MTNLANFFIEVNLLLIIYWLIYIIALRNDPNLRFRRIFILTVIATVPLIPFLSLGSVITQSHNTAMLNEMMFILPGLLVGGSQAVTHSLSEGQWWTHLIITIYGLGSTFLVFRFISHLIVLVRIINDKSNSKTSKIDFILIQTSAYPTFSFFRYLILNQTEKLTETDMQQVIEHEKIHIRQWHSLDILILEILRIMFWLNPAIWALKKLQAENHEFIADRHVVELHNKSAYQNLIARSSLGSMVAYANNFAQLNTLKRFKMMDSKLRSTFGLRQSMAMISLILAMAFFACTDERLLQPDKTSFADLESKDEVDELRTGFPEAANLEIPPKAQHKMDQLKAEFPEIDFVYIEVDPGEQLTRRAMRGGYGIVKDYMVFKGRDKAGLIVVPSVQFTILAEKTKDENGIYAYAQKWPAPEVGIDHFYDYVAENLKYPKQARERGVEGKVFVGFVVDETGSITDVQVLKGIGSGCDEAATAVISNAQRWNPGKLDGEPIKVRMVLPITFKI